jgi:hypothetical protein
MLEELEKLLKESQTQRRRQNPSTIMGQPVLGPQQLTEGDLANILFIRPDQILPEYDEAQMEETFSRLSVQAIFVFNRFEGTTIYGWKGGGIGGVVNVETAKESAVNKYGKYSASGGQAPMPTVITSAYNPELNPILLVTHSDDVWGYIQGGEQVIQEMLPQDGSWLGPRYNSNVWTMVPHCTNQVIDSMMNSDLAVERGIFRELVFDYTRKLQRHYSKPNTFSPNRRVRPHFIYMDVRKPQNQYILTMDMQNAPGEWRSFLIDDAEWGPRMQNVRLGNPFKFTTANILHALKKDIKAINKRLTSKVEDVDERDSIFENYNIYNAMKLYYKHLKKNKKDDNDGKIDKSSSVFLPNIITKKD